MNHDLRLIYGSYGIHDFNLLACLIRNGSDSHFGNISFRILLIQITTLILFVLMNYALVDRVYSKNSFLAQDGYAAPMASLGWLVIELFTAFVQMASAMQAGSSNGNQRSVWLAGFDLSASYVFESISNV